jgi:hypothetical protein
VLTIKERHRYRLSVSDKTPQALRFPEQGTGLGFRRLTACLGTDLMARRGGITWLDFVNDQ